MGEISRRSSVGAGGSFMERDCLEGFFENVDGFLYLMKRQSAVASGSAVLHALLPDAQWEPNDLDICVG